MTETVSISKEKFILSKSIPWKRLAITAGVFFVIAFLVWMIPITLALYYQNQGGIELRKIVTEIDEYQAVTTYCYPPTLTDEQRSDVENAREYLEKSADIKPKDAQTALLLGRVNCLLGETKKAVEAYQRYTELRPDNPLGYLELSFAYESGGNQDDAIQAWLKTDLNSHFFENMGIQALEDNRNDDAIRWFERATLLEPKNAVILFRIGEIYEEDGEWEKASEYYQITLEFDANLATTAAANALHKRGDYLNAERILREALINFPKSAERLVWWRDLGDNLITRENWDQAVQIYQQAISEFPSISSFYTNLGKAYYENGDGIEKALAEFNKAILLNDNNSQIYYEGGRILSREKRFDEADVWFLKALAQSPNVWWFNLGRANNARSARKLTLAIEIYQETIQLYPELANAYYNLAITYQLGDQPLKAIESIEQAIELMDIPNEIYYLRAGEIYLESGDTNNALASYKQVLVINPDNETAKRAVQQLGADQ